MASSISSIQEYGMPSPPTWRFCGRWEENKNMV
jgi:hypothetical protein